MRLSDIHLRDPYVLPVHEHGMLFADFSGRMLLSIHVPNVHPQERPAFLLVRRAGDSLQMEVVCSAKIC